MPTPPAEMPRPRLVVAAGEKSGGEGTSSSGSGSEAGKGSSPGGSDAKASKGATSGADTTTPKKDD